MTTPRAATGVATRVGRPPKVSRDDVVAAAVALADQDGLAAVTIRGVAARLGVAPMTLYGHVAGAGELVDLVVHETITAALHEQPPRPGPMPWDGRSALVGLAHGLRRMLVDHPAVLDAYRRRPVQDPTGVAVAEAVVAALVADGRDEADALTTYGTVYAYVIGFVSLEASRVSGRLAAVFDDAAFEKGLAALVGPEGGTT